MFNNIIQNSVNCGDLVNINQCERISKDIISEGCYWLYDDNDRSVNSGICESRTNNSVECSDVKRIEQCKNNDESTFGTRCSWIYSNNNGDDDDGNCYSKDDTTLTCEDIFEINQCQNGGGITNLNDKCDMYETTCKIKCSELGTGTTCTSNNRENDCFLLKNEDESLNTCRDIVCLFIFIFIFLHLHLYL
jgi:hypothetical protein